MRLRWQAKMTGLIQISTTLTILAVGLLCMYEAVQNLKDRSPAAANAGVSCTVKPTNKIITYFYKSTSSSQQRRALAQHIHGIVRDQYPALHGTSLVVPAALSGSDLYFVRQHSFVISASLSIDQGCQDPD